MLRVFSCKITASSVLSTDCSVYIPALRFAQLAETDKDSRRREGSQKRRGRDGEEDVAAVRDGFVRVDDLPACKAPTCPAYSLFFFFFPSALLQAADDATAIGRGLLSLGCVPRKSKVAIYANTRKEWMLMLHGCASQSMTVVTVYASLGTLQFFFFFSRNRCEPFVFLTLCVGEEGVLTAVEEGEIDTLVTRCLFISFFTIYEQNANSVSLRPFTVPFVCSLLLETSCS